MRQENLNISHVGMAMPRHEQAQDLRLAQRNAVRVPGTSVIKLEAHEARRQWLTTDDVL